jgi:type I restriction enzyme S subunit
MKTMKDNNSSIERSRNIQKDDAPSLPNGWVETTLGEVVDLAQGVAINKKTDYVLCDKSKGVPLLKINNLLNNTVDHYVDLELVPKKAILEKDDVIFTRTGQVGWVFTNKFGVLHNNSFKVIPNDGLSKKFLYWFLKQKSVYNYVQKVAAGSAQPDLNHGAFKTIEIRLPSDVKEQKAIAKILTSFDDKIELLQAQNKTLETIAQTIFKEWFLPPYPLKEESHSLELSSENIPKSTLRNLGANLPEGWRVGKLGELAKLKSGYAFKSKDFVDCSSYKAIKIKDLKGNGVVGISDISSVNENCTKINRVQFFKLKQGDIVIAMSGNTTGKIGIIPPHSNIELYLNQRVGKLFLKNDDLKSYLYYFLMSGNYEEKILAKGYGSAQPNINPTQIEKINIIVPTDDKMHDFLSISNPIFNKVLDNNFQIQTLKQTRDTLLPKLMSGQLRVDEFKEN